MKKQKQKQKPCIFQTSFHLRSPGLANETNLSEISGRSRGRSISACWGISGLARAVRGQSCVSRRSRGSTAGVLCQAGSLSAALRGARMLFLKEKLQSLSGPGRIFNILYFRVCSDFEDKKYNMKFSNTRPFPL